MYDIGIRYVNELFFSQVTRRKTSNDIYTCKRNILRHTTNSTSIYFYTIVILQPRALHSRESGPEPQLDEPLHYPSQGWRGPDRHRHVYPGH